MSDVLARILELKRTHVAASRERVSSAELRAHIAGLPPPRGFTRALRDADAQGRLALIGEIKRASPSRGLIRADFSPVELAAAYARGGAACLSVLTDSPFFQGADEHLAQARESVPLPVLRKDFTIDPYQIVEARTLGADCVLLIMAALADAQAAELADAAAEVNLDVLVEVHDAAELERALRLPCELIGVNNRNLRTLQVDITTTLELAAAVPADRLLVAESGLRTHADLVRLHAAGARAFLVGESLMAQPDVTAATRALLGTEGGA